MKEQLSSLTLQNSTIPTVYPYLSKPAPQVFLASTISTVDCEQGFSTMKRIKTHLRSRTSNVTLNHCMRIWKHQLLIALILTLINLWSILKNRRIITVSCADSVLTVLLLFTVLLLYLCTCMYCSLYFSFFMCL